jgi:hypothetical protein
MEKPVQIEAHRPLPDTDGYSSTVRSVLGFTALVVTLLPIPVIYFGILPAYEKHGWFLLFYTPFLCLLTLCYLFYVRDSLARVTFADVLDPPPPSDPYAREFAGDQLRRGYRRIKGIVLGILPALLVLTSMYCISRYFVAFDESVARSVETYKDRSLSSQSLPAVVGPRERRKRRSAKPPVSEAKPSSEDTAGASQDSTRDSLPLLSDSSAVRDYVLRTTVINEIPQLGKLTAFYLGAFIALLIAVTLMALKEYAKEALGLSEHELMFGRYRRSAPEE